MIMYDIQAYLLLIGLFLLAAHYLRFHEIDVSLTKVFSWNIRSIFD